MARQRFRMAASCRGLRRCLCLRASTFQDRRLPCRALAYLATALAMEARFDRTTSGAANFSLVRLTTGIGEKLHRKTAVPVRRLCAHVGPESDACPQTICNLDRGSVLLSSRH